METSQTTTAVKSSIEEPGPDRPTRIPPFTNGVLKLRQPQPHAPPSSGGTYKECLKNHAAAMGGHAVDGCGEFMPSPTANPSDPTTLRCAACGCHRNFHRCDPGSPNAPTPTQLIEYQPHHRHQPPPPPPRSPNSPSPPPISSTYYPSAPHMLLALSNPNPNLNLNPSPNSSSRKRFRTKFTQIQKDKMYDLAEKLSWKMQRKDDDVITDFCNSIGIEKGVFKVWMHNNKNTLGKKEILANNGSNGIGINLENTSVVNDYQNINFHNSDEVSAHPITTNGSSSSSRD